MQNPAYLIQQLIRLGSHEAPSLKVPLEPPWDGIYRLVAKAGTSRRARQAAFQRAIDTTDEPLRIRFQVEDATPDGETAGSLSPEIQALVGSAEIYDQDQQFPDVWAHSSAAFPSPTIKFHPAALSFAPRLPPTSLIENFLLQPSVNLIVGQSGAKKTFALLDLAVSLAIGEPWLDRPTTHTPVLWVDEEHGLDRFLPRLAQVMRAHNAPDHLSFQFSSLNGFDLRNPDHLQELRQQAHDAIARLIIIDPLAGVIPGVDENNVFQLVPVFRSLRQLANQTNAAILLIHHTNKSGLYRGSTLLRSAVDLMLAVHSSANTPYIEFESLKTRYIPHLNFAAKAHFEPPEDPERVWLTPASLSETRFSARTAKPLSPAHHHVINYLIHHGPSSTADLINSPTDCTPSQARSAIFLLIQDHLIYRTNPGGKGIPAIYDLIK